MAIVAQHVVSTADALGQCTVDLLVDDATNTITGANMTNNTANPTTLTVTRYSTGQTVTLTCQPGKSASRTFPGGLPHFRAAWPQRGDVGLQLG